MALNLKTPGVYLEELSLLPPTVAAVETAIPAFIGFTENDGQTAPDGLPVPVRITSMLEYENAFGYAQPQTGIEVSVEVTAGVQEITVSATEQVKFLMHYSLQMYFANGGGPCYIVSAGTYNTGSTEYLTKLSAGLDAIEKEDEPTILNFPDATVLLDEDEYFGLYKSAIQQCVSLQDRFTIMDTHTDDPLNSSPNPISTLRTKMNLVQNELKYAAAYYPFLKTMISYHYENSDVDVTIQPSTVVTLEDLESDNNLLYNQIKSKIADLPLVLPPSSAMAGIYAKVDAATGVWTSPANVGINNIYGPTQLISNQDQDDMNISISGKSVNAIRTFSVRGTLVWGARTLAGNSSEWRYISVRRLFIFLEESIRKASEAFVFQPNDANTWVRLKGMIENFLINQWKAGALTGSKPEQAFYVNVGLGTTMTAQDILDGKLIIEIGVAAVRPAEFIVLKFTHKMQEA